MFNIDLFLQSLLDNTYIQLVGLFATLTGGWSTIDYFWQKRKVEKQQAIVNRSLICRWFLSFCFLRAYLCHLVYEHLFIGDYQRNIDIDTDFSKDLEQTIALNCAFRLPK